MRALFRVVVAFLCFCSLPAPAQQLRLSIGSIEHPAFSARDLLLQFDGTGAEATIAQLRVAGRDFRDARLSCAEAIWQDPVFECRGGRLSLGRGEPLPLALRYERAGGRLDL